MSKKMKTPKVGELSRSKSIGDYGYYKLLGGWWSVFVVDKLGEERIANFATKSDALLFIKAKEGEKKCEK